MSIKILTALAFTFFCQFLNAQKVTLQISLIYPPEDSLSNATIEIFTLPDTTLFTSRVARPGINSFQVKPLSKYLVTVTGIGLAPAKKIITVSGSSVLVSIACKKLSATLQEATVVSRRPLLRQEDDKTIVDAETLAASSTNAYEVLEKAPGVVVDQDGNVYLTSSAPATIYINGRQMRMSTDDIVALLKSLPAGSINKIEIIRTPSAKYDAANSGGIVNVVLKKGVKIGTTGTVNARFDQGIYSNISAGVSINNSVGKISSYLSYQYTGRTYFEDIDADRYLKGDTLLTQRSSTRYSAITHYIGGGLAMEISKKLEAAYDLRLTAGNTGSHAASANDLSETGSQQEFYRAYTPIVNAGKPLFINNALTAKYKIDSLGSEWASEIGYTYNGNNSTQAYTNNYLLPVAPAVYGNGAVDNTSHIAEIKSDLSLHLIDQFLLETGMKISDATNNNQARYYIQTGNQPQQPDPYQTNTFTYKDNINSAYLQLSRTFHGLNIKSGLRFENTEIAGHQLVPSDTSFSIKRNDLFPYFYLRRPLFKIFGYPLTGNATWRRSITRPGYDALSPSPKFVDPYTYNVGNTRLQPQFTTNYEINSTYNDFPVFAIGVNDTKNIFSQVTYQDDSSKIAYRTYDNLGKYKEVYGRLFGGLPAGGRYFMYAGVQFNHIRYIGEYQGAPLRYTRASWTFFTGHELKLTPNLKLNVNGWMYVKGFRQFNELKNMGQLNASITRTFLDKKLSIILSGNDILRTNRSAFHLQQGDVQVNGTRTLDSRRFGLTCRYNFGLTRKEEKKDLFAQPPVNTDPNQ